MQVHGQITKALTNMGEENINYPCNRNSSMKNVSCEITLSTRLSELIGY